MPAVEEEKLSMDSNGKKDSGREVYAQERIQVTEKRVRAFLLAAIVFFMTFIFAELDNAVTLVHAEGSADVGQWPRLLLAVSGLAAGMLYDIRESRCDVLRDDVIDNLYDEYDAWNAVYCGTGRILPVSGLFFRIFHGGIYGNSTGNETPRLLGRHGACGE